MIEKKDDSVTVCEQAIVSDAVSKIGAKNTLLLMRNARKITGLYNALCVVCKPLFVKNNSMPYEDYCAVCRLKAKKVLDPIIRRMN